MAEIISPEEAAKRLYESGSLNDVCVKGMLKLGDGKFQKNAMFTFMDVIVEGNLRFNSKQLVGSLGFFHVTVKGGVFLGNMKIEELVFTDTVIHGSLYLRGTKTSEVLDLSGLKATAIVIDYKLCLLDRAWERSADFLHYAAPAIPIIYDLRVRT